MIKVPRFGKCTDSKFEKSMTNGGCAVVMNNFLCTHEIQ